MQDEEQNHKMLGLNKNCHKYLLFGYYLPEPTSLLTTEFSQRIAVFHSDDTDDCVNIDVNFVLRSAIAGHSLLLRMVLRLFTLE